MGRREHQARFFDDNAYQGHALDALWMREIMNVRDVSLFMKECFLANAIVSVRAVAVAIAAFISAISRRTRHWNWRVRRAASVRL